MPTKTTRRKKVPAKTRRTAKRRSMTPEDMLRFTLVGSPQISPDGESIVFIHKQVGKKNEYVTNLWMVDVAGDGEPRQFTSGEKDSHPRWSHDGSRIAFISARDKTKPQIYTIEANGGEAVALTDFPEGSIESFKWSGNGKWLAVEFRAQDPQWTEESKKRRKESGESIPPRVLDHYWYRLDGDGYFNAQRYALYLVDTKTGKHRQVYAKDALGYFPYDFSPDSKKIVIATNRDQRALLKPWNSDLFILNIASGKASKLRNLPKGPKAAVCWSPDGQSIAYAGRVSEDSEYSVENLEVFVCNARGGSARSLTANEDYCLMAITLTDTSDAAFSANIQWSHDSKRIYMKLGWHGESHVASVLAKGGKITFHTSGTTDHDVGNLSADGSRIALTGATATSLGEIYVGTIGGKTTRTKLLTDFNGSLLSKVHPAGISSHWVKSTDGAKVQVWIMKPPDFKASRKYPAVLEIHGGPHAQYGVGFFHEFQSLAAAGYVVFFSNPRGSKGYGRDHCAAIKGSWGGVDWEDIQAVTKFIQTRSYVNKKRMGVMGGSYGGYMTNWVIGHCHDFAGAITDRCVSNLVSMFGSSDFIDREDDYWPGNAWDRPEARWAQSPIKYFGEVKTPTLIIHSEGDLRCNIEQSDQVFTALWVKKVPTRYVRYPNTTSHGLSRGGPPDLRIHRLRQILSWWKRWL